MPKLFLNIILYINISNQRGDTGYIWPAHFVAAYIETKMLHGQKDNWVYQIGNSFHLDKSKQSFFILFFFCFAFLLTIEIYNSTTI